MSPQQLLALLIRARDFSRHDHKLGTRYHPVFDATSLTDVRSPRKFSNPGVTGNPIVNAQLQAGKENNGVVKVQDVEPIDFFDEIYKSLDAWWYDWMREYTEKFDHAGWKRASDVRNGQRLHGIRCHD